MGKHLLGCIDMKIDEINQIMDRAAFLQKNERELSDLHLRLQKKYIANLFLEPSTRTRFSFEIAEKRLGLQVLNFEAAKSSLQKGESLYDTLKTIESLGVDAAVIRTNEDILTSLADKLNIKIINAGEGKKEHPTQALLDLFTIKKYFTDLKGLKIAIIGDIAHSRVARSNTYLLNKMGARLIFSGPKNLMVNDLAGEYLPINEAIQEADVVMMLRIQFERMEERYINSKESYNKDFGLTEERLKLLQPHAIILHPAPVNRGVEMDDIVVEHPQSKIFEQITNGVYIRMAVIEHALEG